jgi:multimeric flavodoxin WrbA
MKIISIVGSTRRGNTYAMVEAGSHALTSCDLEFIHLKDLQIQNCDGCLTCDESGECHYNDKMNDVIASIKETDGFIFGTPSRWGLLSGELKVFFDRLNPMAVSEGLKGKKAIIFAVGQTKNEEAASILSAVESVKTFCDNAGIEVVDSIIAEGCLESDDLIKNHVSILDKCKISAIGLYASLNK